MSSGSAPIDHGYHFDDGPQVVGVLLKQRTLVQQTIRTIRARFKRTNVVRVSDIESFRGLTLLDDDKYVAHGVRSIRGEDALTMRDPMVPKVKRLRKNPAVTS